MKIKIKLKDSNSCLGCPVLNIGRYNESWFCNIGMGSISVSGKVSRPRPDSCKKYFKAKKEFEYEEYT